MTNPIAVMPRIEVVKPSGKASDAVGPIVVTVIVIFIAAWVLAGAVFISQHFYGGGFLVNSLVTVLVMTVIIGVWPSAW